MIYRTMPRICRVVLAATFRCMTILPMCQGIAKRPDRAICEKQDNNPNAYCLAKIGARVMPTDRPTGRASCCIALCHAALRCLLAD